MKLKNLLEEILLEYRDKLYAFLKADLIGVPEYIIRDFFYKGFKHSKNFTTPGTEDNIYYNRYKTIDWDYKKDFPIRMDMFDPISKERLEKRIGGDMGKHQAPNDELRHEKQKELLQTKGLTEPIILFISADDPDKYSLGEGWHRVIQLFKANPKGFKYPNVYIGRYPDQDFIDF
jgi:hypothetical protein